MRSEKEIKAYLEELEQGIRNLRENRHKYRDEEAWRNMIRENMHRISTLEWVMGQHERWD